MPTTKQKTHKMSMPLSIFFGCVAIYIIADVYASGLNNIAIITGWILFSMVFFQSFYQGKKFGQIRMGTSAVWLGCHIAMGILSLAVFMYHVNWRMPNGIFEVIFTFIYVGTVASGILGLYLYRTLPRKFLQGPEELTFQRIPQRIRKLRKEAEQIALSSVSESETTVLAEYYNEYLAKFFLRPKLLFRHIVRPSDKNLKEIKNSEILICRVLNEQEAEKVKKLVHLAEQKNELDYQYTLKHVIKAWVFIHAPLAFSTMILMIVHTVIIYAYVS